MGDYTDQDIANEMKRQVYMATYRGRTPEKRWAAKDRLEIMQYIVEGVAGIVRGGKDP